MLGLAVFEGFAGYSLVDDLISGMGLAIAYSVAMSIPVVGGDVAHAFWAGQFPGGPELLPRLFILHVLIVPVAIAALVSLHLAMVIRHRHAQFPGPLRRERNVVGTPMWPGYALRSLALLLLTAAVLVAMGGLVQINPIWLWGPYDVSLGSNGAQPDWYLGWLIGALRLMPPFEPHVAGYTLAPTPFWGGLLFPTVVFGVLYAWPWLEQRFITRDRARHDLLDLPHANPVRTAFGAGFFTWVATIFIAGSADRLFLLTDIPYMRQVWLFRAGAIVLPVVVAAIVYRWASAARRSE
jgi:ubiquinol-cytochrome c reductase cytochrome b subunit